MFFHTRRRHITPGEIGSPMEFMHVDGSSFLNLRVIDLEEARYDVLLRRLKSPFSSAKKNTPSAVIARRQCDRQSPRLLVSHKCAQQKPHLETNEAITTLDISPPFDFVHVTHVALKDVPRQEDTCTVADGDTPATAVEASSSENSDSSVRL